LGFSQTTFAKTYEYAFDGESQRILAFVVSDEFFIIAQSTNQSYWIDLQTQ